jgi:DNA-binding NtrC family response regulator
VLVVDQDRELLTTVGGLALAEGFEVSTTVDTVDALAQLRHRPAHVALVDTHPSGPDAVQLLRAIRDVNPRCRVVLMSGEGSDERAIEAVASGAADYLRKPLDVRRVRGLLTAVRQEDAARRAVLILEAELAERLEFCGMVGRGPAMQSVFDLIRRLAPHARLALITGEPGTGKELAARALHSLGPRRSRPFIVVDCSAVVETLLERELFGYGRAVFAGQAPEKAGLFEIADGGTLFFDHVGELPLSIQDRVLRVVETGRIRRIGSTESQRVDVQVIGATERPLAGLVAAGRFNAGFYERFRIAEVTLPPLRERIEDLVYLSARFIRRFADRFERPLAGLTPGAERLLRDTEWHGNVRQLRHTLERACILAEGEFIMEAELSAVSPARSQHSAVITGITGERASLDMPAPLSAIEREHIVRTLDQVKGNKAVAARVLGVSRRAFYRQLERHGLHTRVPADPRTTSKRVAMVEHS